MTELTDSHQELLRFAITERDAFYDLSTDAEGSMTDPGDQAELDRMIDRAVAATSGTKSLERVEFLAAVPGKFEAAQRGHLNDATHLITVVIQILTPVFNSGQQKLCSDEEKR